MSYDYVCLVSDSDWELHQIIPNGNMENNTKENSDIDHSYESKIIKKVEQTPQPDTQLNVMSRYNKNNVLIGYSPN
jgi:hypothetical protein